MRVLVRGLAAAFCIGAFSSTADAAVVGGASFDASGTYDIDAVTGGYFAEVEGAFFAESLIADLDAPQSFLATATLMADGSTLFSDSLLLPPLAPNDVVALAIGAFGAFGSLDPAPLPGFDVSGTLDFSPVISALAPIFFAIDITGLTSNSASGAFLISTFLSDSLLADLRIGDPSGTGSFSLSISLTPVSAVPLPAALPLALGGIGVFAGLGFRRRAERAA